MGFKEKTLTSGHTSCCNCRRCDEKRNERKQERDNKSGKCPVNGSGVHEWVWGVCNCCGEDLGPEDSDDFMDL